MQLEKEFNKLILVMGNIGTGKTTFINSLKKRPNRVFVKSDDYHDSFESTGIIEKNLRNGKDVIYEGVFTHKSKRVELINYLKQYFRQCNILCYDFGPGDINTLKRRAAEDKTKSFEEWKQLHNVNKFNYEIDKPLQSEGYSKIIRKY